MGGTITHSVLCNGQKTMAGCACAAGLGSVYRSPFGAGFRGTAPWREENCFAGGGGMARKPICPTPPSPSLVAVPGGGFGLRLPYLPCRGGGGSDPNIHGSK